MLLLYYCPETFFLYLILYFGCIFFLTVCSTIRHLKYASTSWLLSLLHNPCTNNYGNYSIVSKYLCVLINLICTVSVRSRKSTLEMEFWSQWNQTQLLTLTSVRREFHHSRHSLHLKHVFVTEIYATTKATSCSALARMFRILELCLTTYVSGFAWYIWWCANNPKNAIEILWGTAWNCSRKKRARIYTDILKIIFRPARNILHSDSVPRWPY